MTLSRLLPPPGPPRVFAVGQFVDALGTGLWATVAVVFYVNSVGLTAAQAGFGVALGGIAGVLAGPLCGHLADRLGLRGTAVVLGLAQTVLMAAFVLVHAYWSFLVLVCLFEFFRRGGQTARLAFVAATVDPERRVRTRAHLRSVLAAGWALGSLLSAAVLTADTRTAYVLVIAGNAVSFLLSGVLYLRVPAIPPVPADRANPSGVWRDHPFLALTVVIGLLRVDASVFNVALPLWILTYTDAPRATVAGLLVLNAALVVVLQVPATRGADTIPGAGRLVRRGAFTAAAACLLFPLTLHLGTWAAVAVLIVAAVLLTAAELWNSAGGFTISMGLAPPHAVGAYQGVFGLGISIQNGLGPALVTALAIGLGGPGWILLALFSAGLGLLARPLAELARRRNRTFVLVN